MASMPRGELVSGWYVMELSATTIVVERRDGKKIAAYEYGGIEVHGHFDSLHELRVLVELLRSQLRRHAEVAG